ncbi:hypothetical protein ACFX5U_09585 [Sphingobacterium sp. SG20118]|uniref:hypothetical protein n=1 Tax=Sphingobacterium sp. SG20118 TaxID=3367156 RepID=UPI0037DFC465
MSFKFIASLIFLALQDLNVINKPLFKRINHQHFKQEVIDEDFKQLAGICINNTLNKNAIA